MKFAYLGIPPRTRRSRTASSKYQLECPTFCRAVMFPKKTTVLSRVQGRKEESSKPRRCHKIKAQGEPNPQTSSSTYHCKCRNMLPKFGHQKTLCISETVRLEIRRNWLGMLLNLFHSVTILTYTSESSHFNSIYVDFDLSVIFNFPDEFGLLLKLIFHILSITSLMYQ